MSKRSVDWEDGLAKDLRKPGFAQEFIAALIEEGMSLHEALGTTIRAYGVKEFAQKVGLPSSNVSRAIQPAYNPSKKVLQQLLAPFQLRLAVIPDTRDDEDRAA